MNNIPDLAAKLRAHLAESTDRRDRVRRALDGFLQQAEALLGETVST